MLAVLFFVSLFSLAVAECPNGCSGHGDCGTKDACACYDGFFGGDCSLRVCPAGKGFVDTPRGDLNHNGLTEATGYSIVQGKPRNYQQYESWPNTASLGGWTAQAGETHFDVECSGKGSCDRTMGVCKCFDGYTGASCQRTTCPNSCSNHGVCTSVSSLAEDVSTRSFAYSTGGTVTYSGVLSPQVYRLWDDGKNRACVCDPGYSGFDCSLMECPYGDDPLTWADSTCGGTPCVSETQSFSMDGNQASAQYVLTFSNFNGAQFPTSPFTIASLDPIANPTQNTANAAAIAAALSAIPNNVTGTVSVLCSGGATAGGVNGNGMTYTSVEASKVTLRCSVTFSSKSGNIPAMALTYVGAASGHAYLFQPSRPVQTLTFPPAQAPSGPSTSYRAVFRIFPMDTSLFPNTQDSSTGLPTYAYWTSPLSAAFALDSNQVGAGVTAIAAALNAIPIIAFAYPGYFIADNNVVGQVTSLGGFTVSVVFPDFLTGQIPMTFQFEPAATYTSYLSTTTFRSTNWVGVLGDNVDGNREAVSCSNRGICDFTSGLCQCFAGQTGEDCSQQSALARGPTGYSAGGR